MGRQAGFRAAGVAAVVLLMAHALLTANDSAATSAEPGPPRPVPTTATTPPPQATEITTARGPVPTTVPSGGATSPPPTTNAPSAKETLAQLLTRVDIVPARPNRRGYDRDCSPGSGCVFGTAWNDDTDAPLGRNGCDTRNDVLRQDLVDTVIDPKTRGCVVRRGTLHDPYTGRTIRFERGWNTSIEVQIDHLVPLAAAWDLGAADWPRDRREAFANDVRFELLAVDGLANQAKSDGTPSEWLPPDLSFHCAYAIRYLRASIHWRLPVSRADHDALTRIADQRCAE